MMKRWTAVVACSVFLLTPATAQAEWYVFPFASVNTGGDTTQESGAFGGALGWMGHWFGVEAEAAVSPSFFDDGDGFRTEHRETTYTATALAAPRLGIWRPYAAAGVGVLRTNIEEIGGLATLSDNRPALHLGGGVAWEGMPHIGFRGDVRYIRALDDEESEGNVFAEQLANFSYWRAGGGVTLRW